jgi:hypothetical protein
MFGRSPFNGSGTGLSPFAVPTALYSPIARDVIGSPGTVGAPPLTYTFTLTSP